MPPPSAPRPFVAPGPGTWIQDSTHSPRPVTAYHFEAFKDAFPKGFREGTARFGLLFDYLHPELVNGFVYYRHVLVDPSNKEEVARRFESARHALEHKLWLRELERWDREFMPDSIQRNRALEAVPMQTLDTEAFIRHLVTVRENASEMVYRHHIFTAASIMAVGRYVAHAMEWTGWDSGRLLAPLQGSSAVSLGAHEELRHVGALLKQAGVEPATFGSQSADQILDALRAREDALGAAVRAYFAVIGMRLAGGYDVADACAIELPDLLLGAIWASTGESKRPAGDEAATRVRAAVPAEHRAAFDELLAEARQMNRLRDERGIYNDMWGTGIARQSLLECGRRLVATGRLDRPEHAVDASLDELISMLRGTGGPSREELDERRDWRLNASLAEVPPFLGPPPSPPPPLDGLPPHAFEAMRALGTAMGELFTPPSESEGKTIVGKAVSPGIYTGRARLVMRPEDMNRLTKGDVLVTSATSPAFNLVLPLVGAIVTDRGGQLSHAAIVAREYGIPAVVGTGRATADIAEGALVKVDGTAGKILLL